MRLRMKWIIGIIRNIIYGSKINKHPTTTIFQCAWFTHRHSSVILGSFQGVIVIRLPRNFVYLCYKLYSLMINDLNTTSLVYLWSVDTVSQSLHFQMNCLWQIYLCIMLYSSSILLALNTRNILCKAWEMSNKMVHNFVYRINWIIIHELENESQGILQAYYIFTY